MNVVTTDISPSRQQITVSFPAAEAVVIEADVLKAVVKQAKVPGFRPGKAPVAMVKARYAGVIAEEMDRAFLQKAYEHIMKDSSLRLYRVIKAEKLPSGEGQEVAVSIEADIAPDVNLGDYKGLEISCPAPIVTDAEVERALEERRQALAQFEVADRAIEKGDYAKISYTATINGQPLKTVVADAPEIFCDQQNTWEEAGSVDAPGVAAIVQGLIGLKTGDSASFTQVFAEDFAEKALAGKTVDYTVTVHEVRTRVLPALDNAEFLKHHQVETVEALCEALKKHIENARKAEVRDLQANKLLEILRNKANFEVPESAVEAKMPEMVNRFLASPAARQTSKESLDRDKDKILSELRGLSLRRVKDEFILDAIIGAEKLTAGEEDLQKAAWYEAMSSRTPLPQYIKQLEKDRDALRAFQRRVLQNKALEFLIQSAKITEEAPAV